MAFSDHFGLEVDCGWINEEARLDANSLHNSLETRNRVIKACKFKWQSEFLGIFDSLRLVLELEHEWIRAWSDAQLNVAFGIFVILILLFFFLLLLAEWVDIVSVQISQVLIFGLLFDRDHDLRVHIVIGGGFRQNEIKFWVLSHI